MRQQKLLAHGGCPRCRLRLLRDLFGAVPVAGGWHRGALSSLPAQTSPGFRDPIAVTSSIEFLR